MTRGIVYIILAFMLGVFVAEAFSLASGQSPPSDQYSPSDLISEEQVHVYSDYVRLDVAGAQWASFTDTKSMDPIIDVGAHALQIIPDTPDQVDVGDIISYRKDGEPYRIIHRVVYKGEDDKGIYFIVKGDNNPVADPGKVRFDQIERLLFAIIY